MHSAHRSVVGARGIKQPCGLTVCLSVCPSVRLSLCQISPQHANGALWTAVSRSARREPFLGHVRISSATSAICVVESIDRLAAVYWKAQRHSDHRTDSAKPPNETAAVVGCGSECVVWRVRSPRRLTSGALR